MSCIKISYPSKSVADMAAEWWIEHGGDAQMSYPCRDGGKLHYHLRNVEKRRVNKNRRNR